MATVAEAKAAGEYGGWPDWQIQADLNTRGGHMPNEQEHIGKAGVSAPAFDMAGYLATQKAEGAALRAKQSAEEDALFKTFQAKSAAQPKLTDVYTNLMGTEGVTGLQKTSNDILGMIDSLNKDVTARTSGTLTNEAQRKRMYASELQPLTESLAPVSRSLETARGNVATQLQLTTADQTKELETERMRIAATSDRFARETTGYTQDRQDNLTLLLNKIQADQALSQREWDAAQALAKSERDFENARTLNSEKIAQESAAAIKLKQTLEPKAGTGVITNPFLAGGETTKVGTSVSDQNRSNFNAPISTSVTNVPGLWFNQGLYSGTSAGRSVNYGA